MSAEPVTCPHCHGRGEIGIIVQWSDGPGGSSMTCPVCNGAKTINFNPVTELAQVNILLREFIRDTWRVISNKTEPEKYDPKRYYEAVDHLRRDLQWKIHDLPDHIRPYAKS